MGFEILIQIYGIWKYLHNFAPPSMNLLLETYGSDSSSDDEDFVVRAPTPRTTVNGRKHAHLLNLLSYYLLTNPDFAPTESFHKVKMAKTTPKLACKDLSEDVCRTRVISFSPRLSHFFVRLMTSFFHFSLLAMKLRPKINPFHRQRQFLVRESGLEPVLPSLFSCRSLMLLFPPSLTSL